MNGTQTVTVASTASLSADGNRRGFGGTITLNGDLGVVQDGPVTATSDGTVTITP